jgi:hypothetical protein
VDALGKKMQELDAREVAEVLKRESPVCERDGAANGVRMLESEVGDGRRIGERDEKSVFCTWPFLLESDLMAFVHRLYHAHTQYQTYSSLLGPVNVLINRVS